MAGTVITYAEARTRAASTGLALGEDRESANWWFFGTREIGCKGVIIDKRDGSLTRIGSAYPVDDFLWGYDAGIREEPVDFVVTEVFDQLRATTWLYENGFEGSRVYVREKLAKLPAIWPALSGLWSRIPQLRALDPAVMRWHVESPTDR
jgi:hypothetical protein